VPHSDTVRIEPVCMCSRLRTQYQHSAIRENEKKTSPSSVHFAVESKRYLHDLLTSHTAHACDSSQQA
jgi:hypothetical protein